jgi:hypothetical protein
MASSTKLSPKEAMKMVVLGGRTDVDPGPEVALLRYDAAINSGSVRRTDRLILLVELMFEACQDGWGELFGPEKSNWRSAKQWCEHLLELDQRMQQWREQDITNSPQWQSRELQLEVWCIGGPCVRIKEGLDALQTHWEGEFGRRWMSPRQTIADWCDDLLAMMDEREEAIDQRDEARNSLLELGWDWEAGRWLPDNDPIWKKLHDKKFASTTGRERS